MSKENVNIEKENRSASTKVFVYETPDDALRLIQGFSLQQKDQMAKVYKSAFAGSPWFEKFVCPACGSYAAHNQCGKCSKSDLPEAYQREALVNDVFPKMLTTFSPGVLLLSYGDGEQINGFSTGGIVSVEALINTKYEGNKTILAAIKKQYNVFEDTSFFYDNETCIDPMTQKSGIGRTLSEGRIRCAVLLGADIICGRTINMPWLALKERQLTAAGFGFSASNPEGDTYSINGVSRQFYVAKKNTIA